MARERQELNITDVFEFEKSGKKVAISAIPVTVRGGEERLYVGVREKYKDKEGKWLPSEKGTTFEAKHLDALITAAEYAKTVDQFPEEEHINIIPKNSMEEIHLDLKNYMKAEYLDIRSYFKDKENNIKPSKKGLTVPPDCLDDLLEGLNKFKQTYPQGVN